MRLAGALGLIDRLVNRIVLAAERRIVFRPHLGDDLARLAEPAHAFACLGEAIAVRPPLMLVPARPQPAVEPSVAQHVYRGRHLGQQRRVAVAVAGHHLADVDPAGIAGKRCGDRPALEGGVEGGLWDRMEVIVDPDRVENLRLVSSLRHARHRLILLDGIDNLSEIHPPALGHEDAKPHMGTHAYRFLLLLVYWSSL